MLLFDRFGAAGNEIPDGVLATDGNFSAFVDEDGQVGVGGGSVGCIAGSDIE